MSDAQRDDDGGWLDRLDDVPLVGGFLGGIASFLGGYVLFLALLTGTGEIPRQTGVVNALRSVAQAFYNAFNVPTYQRQTISIESANSTRETVVEVWQNSVTGFRRVTQRQVVDGQTVDTQTQSGTIDTALAAPDVVYLLVPVVAVLLVGLVVGYRVVDADTDDPNVIALQSVGGGVAMGAGFLVLSLGLTFVLVRTGTNAMLHPARMEAILYGIAYPLIGGTAGIAVGQLAQAQRRESVGGGGSADDPTEWQSNEVEASEPAETPDVGGGIDGSGDPDTDERTTEE